VDATQVLIPPRAISPSRYLQASIRLHNIYKMNIINLSITILLLTVTSYGQESNSEIKLKIDSFIRASDSIGKIEKEGISEGEIRYNHISGKYGWGAYFLNNPKYKKEPLRIRYSETQPKSNEVINLYYQNGILVFAELITTPTSRTVKRKNSKTKHFYFNENDVIYPDITDSDIDYVLEKEKTIRKMIYD
jgi:hypothetical protein